MILVLTIGTFDLLHVGHLRLLCRAAQFGPLTVGVNSDAFVEKYRGRPPIVSERARIAAIEAVGLPATMHLNDGPGRDLIERLRPDLLVVGSDWHARAYHAQIGCTLDELDEWNVGVCYLPRTPGISSTQIREAL